MALSCIPNSPIPFDSDPACDTCFNTEYCHLVETTDTTELQFQLTPVTGVNVLPEGAFNPQSQGTADGTSANKLVNSGATFATDGVIIGAMVKNTTDNTYASVTAIDSETQLSLDANIFVSGEDYIIINWDIVTGTLGTDVTFDGTSISFQTSGATVRILNKLTTNKKYRIKVSMTTNGIGVGRLTINNNSTTTYFNSGLLNHVETVVFVTSSGDDLRLSYTDVLGNTTFNITDIEIVEMSSIYYELRDCDDAAVVYATSTTLGVSYNVDVQYQDNPNAIFYGALRLDWAGYEELPNPGCFCLCVKDNALGNYEFLMNTNFDVISDATHAEYWTVTNSGASGWSFSGADANHTDEVAAGEDVLSQTLEAPLDATLCYNLSFDYDSDNGFTVTVKYDTADLTDEVLEVVTKALGTGTQTIAITNIPITAIKFVADDDQQVTLSAFSLTLDETCWACECESTCISLTTNHDNTYQYGCNLLIEATNDNNAFGFNYEDFVGFTQRIRIFGKLRNASYQDENEFYTKSTGETVLVYASQRKVIEFQTWEMPEYMHDVLNMMLLHDTFTIDGVEYVKVGEYAPNWRKSSEKAGVIVQIAKAQQNMFNTYS